MYSLALGPISLGHTAPDHRQRHAPVPVRVQSKAAGEQPAVVHPEALAEPALPLAAAEIDDNAAAFATALLAGAEAGAPGNSPTPDDMRWSADPDALSIADQLA